METLSHIHFRHLGGLLEENNSQSAAAAATGAPPTGAATGAPTGAPTGAASEKAWRHYNDWIASDQSWREQLSKDMAGNDEARLVAAASSSAQLDAADDPFKRVYFGPGRKPYDL